MSEKLVATLSVPFTDEDGNVTGQNRIILEQTTKRLDTQGKLYARCFPASDVNFIASVGSVTPAESRSQTMREALQFSNSSRVNLRFPRARNVTITPLVFMRKTKNTYGDTVIVPATNIMLRYDQATNEVVAEAYLYENTYQLQEVKVYGGCVVNYQSNYRIIGYLPNVQPNVNNGYIFNVGTIFAYNNYDVASVDMEFDLTSAPDWVEYARVTSKVVLDAEGTHETPHGWPQTTQFTSYSTKELDPDNSFTDERTHCIIHVNTIGSLRYEDFNNGGDGYWAWFDPMFGYDGWSPQYELKFSDAPGGSKAGSAADFQHYLNNRTWRDVFLEVDKEELRERLNREYPGITEGQKGGNY